MKIVRQKITIVGLICLLVLGAATNGTALTVSCAAKACCCAKKNPIDLHPDGNGLMRLTNHCAPMTLPPCCHFKSVQPKTESAIIPRPKITADHAAMLLQPSGSALTLTQQFATKTPILEDEKIRAPSVPIYLLTLTILC
jgi:hypothetical protein